jgi:hypothetical protein
MNAYPYDETADEIAAALRQESPEAQEAYRYLFARVALHAGILQLVALEAGKTPERMVCREVATGAIYAVERPGSWSKDEGEAYVAEMRKRMHL